MNSSTSYKYLFFLIAALLFFLVLHFALSIELLTAALICALLYILSMVYGSSRISSNFYLKSLCRLKTNKKVIAITFDDGPSGQTTQVLNILKKYNAEAAFFIMGKNVQGSKDSLKRIVTEGHIVGNHSFSHSPRFPIFSKKKMLEDVKLANEVIFDATAVKPVLFRPPYGVTNPRIAACCKKLGLRVAGWSLRSFDTRGEPKEVVLKRLKRNLHPGCVALFHDTAPQIVLILDEFIDLVKKNGYEIVRFDRLFEINPYE